jgi:hypothetical protein
MIETIDLIFNQYIRIFVGIVIVGLILFSLYYSYNYKIRKLLVLKTGKKDK